MNLTHTASDFASADEPDDKFAFGRNWSNFLKSLDETTIVAAQSSLRKLLNVEDLKHRRFLDAGSGSGLFSLAAHDLGAEVVSFDADADSVRCTDYLHQRAGRPETWRVLEGSLLDAKFLADIAPCDVVYCWGVAHHTGEMWRALENLAALVGPGGQLVVAIYNDQQYHSRAWHGVKRIYQRLPGPMRGLYVLVIWIALFLQRLGATLLAATIRLVTLRNPLAPLMNWYRETRARGMNRWYDLVDWVGGWPFEVARPEEVFRFFRDRGFTLQEMTTSGGYGCNEFVFGREVRSEK